MKRYILAAALLAFCSPAFAGGYHGGGTPSAIGGTSATSGSFAGVASCDCGTGRAHAVGGNVSTGTASIGPGWQNSTTTSDSYGAGAAYHGHYAAGGEGTSSAFTFGGFR